MDQDWSVTAEAKDTLKEMLEIIKSTLASGEDIMISGFGKFQVNEKAPRKGRNIATGKEMMLDGRKMATFKCSGKLRDQINKIYRKSKYSAYTVKGWLMPHIRPFGTASHTNAM